MFWIVVGFASADDLSIGYCDGGLVNPNVTPSSAKEVAIRFSDTTFSMYHGSKIVGVRIGLTEDMPNGVKLFVRNGLDGKNLFEMITGSLFKGWNDVDFGTVVDYPQNDLVIGCADAQYVGMSGDAWPDGYWILSQDKWLDESSKTGQSLCLQALVEGNSYTTNDAAILSIDASYAGKSKRFAVSGKLRNNTNQYASTATIAYNIDGQKGECETSFDEILPGEIGSFSIDLDAPDKIGKYDVQASVKSINGVADEYDSNNAASTSVTVVGEVIPKNVLIEEFTSQDCVNCPSGQARIEEGVEGVSNYVLVAHHYGFAPDIFTAPDSYLLQRFYNSENTFAPAMMIDRTNMSKVGIETPGPIMSVYDGSIIRSLIDMQSSPVSLVAIDIKRNYDETTRELRIGVSSHVVEGFEVKGSPVLTVLLLEDGVIAEQKPNFKEYVHNNACRRFVSSANGDALTFIEGHDAEKTYTEQIPEGWNASNMRIVAFVSNYDAEDCNNCEVYNAEVVKLVGKDNVETGVMSVNVDGKTVAPVGIYNLQGYKFNTLRKGLNIVHYSDGSVRKVIVK